MATVTATRAASTFPVFQPMGAGNLGVAYGSYAYTAEAAAGDILEVCKVPAGAVILGGWLRVGDMDTDANETMDLDVGYAANGAVVADPDAFGNFGVLNGDAVTNVLPEGGVWLPLHGALQSGPITLTRETTIIVTHTDDVATFTAATVTVVVLFAVP